MLFAAKSYWPGLTPAEFEHRAAADLAAASSGEASYLGALLLSDSSIALCIFAADAAAAVRRATAHAHVPCDRVIPIDWVPSPRVEETRERPATAHAIHGN